MVIDVLFACYFLPKFYDLLTFYISSLVLVQITTTTITIYYVLGILVSGSLI